MQTIRIALTAAYLLLFYVLSSSTMVWATETAENIASDDDEAEIVVEISDDDEENDPMVKLSETVVTIPLEEGVDPDDAVTSMKLKANELNLSLVGFNNLSKGFESMNFKNIQRAEIYQFCSPKTAKVMLDFDINFMAYMPCRIGLVEDAKGKFWLVTMNLNLFLSAHDLPPELNTLAIKIRDDIEAIMESGAAGDL